MDATAGPKRKGLLISYFSTPGFAVLADARCDAVDQDRWWVTWPAGLLDFSIRRTPPGFRHVEVYILR